MRAGDRILVCSDGLTRQLDDGLIADVLRTTPDPDVAAKSLITAAIGDGGRDDVTALVVDVLAIRDHRSEAVVQANGPMEMAPQAPLRSGFGEVGCTCHLHLPPPLGVNGPLTFIRSAPRCFGCRHDASSHALSLRCLRPDGFSDLV
jgi:hypothetical protein